jgi:hypothetical protein
MCGLVNVREQCLLAAIAQYIKKIVRLLSPMGTHLPPEQRLISLHRLLIHATQWLPPNRWLSCTPNHLQERTPPKSGGGSSTI